MVVLPLRHRESCREDIPMTDPGEIIISRTVAVDFDGVIHAYTKGWQDGEIYDEANEGALDALEYLLTRWYVVIHTSRSPRQVAGWLTEHGFTVTVDSVISETSSLHMDGTTGLFWSTPGVLLVTRRKFAAIAYIDDRAIRFHDWEQALADLERVANGKPAPR
jgi:hypothetical protein